MDMWKDKRTKLFKETGALFTYGKLVGLGILGLKDDSAVDGDTRKVGIQLRDSGQDSTLHSNASSCIAMVLI